MRHLYRLILSLSCFFLLNACQKGKEEEIVIVTSDPEFQIDLFEQRDPGNGNPTLGLWVRSVEKYPCLNYVIVSTTEILGTEIRIRLNEVRPPDLCVNGSGSAQAFIPIGNLSPGTYPISITLASAIENKGVLTVNSDGYSIYMPHPQAINFSNVVLKKIPEGLVWGYIATPDNTAAQDAAAFLADLKNITTENNLQPGFYSYFTLSGTGLISLHAGFAPSGDVQAFVRQSAATPQDLQQLLQQYRSAPQSPIQIRCLTTFGEF